MFAEIKGYLIGAVIVILIACGIWYTVRIEKIATQTVELRDAKIHIQQDAIVAAAKQHNTDVAALAQLKSQLIGEHYDEVVHTPIGDSPSVVCVKPASTGGSGLPKAPGSQPGNHGEATGAVEDSGNPGPLLDKVGRDADAQIEALQSQVQVLVDAMNGKTK